MVMDEQKKCRVQAVDHSKDVAVIDMARSENLI